MQQNLSNKQKEIIYKMINVKLNNELKRMKKREIRRNVILGVVVFIIFIASIALIF